MALHSSELGLSAIASLDQSEPETMGPLACLHLSHGRTLAKLGRLAESLLAHNSALATLRLLGHRELDIVRTLSELSGNFRALGRYDDALRYAQEAEALALAAPGGETLTFLPQLTSISSALGGLFLHLDRPKEAIACYRLCKTRSIRFYGGRSLQTAEATTDLGIALCGIRDLAGAEVQLRAAESIYRQRGWSDKTADELHLGMGQLMMRQGRYVVALDRYERSLAIMRTNLAPDNPRIAVVLDCIGAIHRRMDRPDAACTASAAATAIFRRSETFCTGPHCERPSREDGAPLEQCAGCLRTYYCSVACQTADWKRKGGHRAECKSLAAELRPVEGAAGETAAKLRGQHQK